MVCSRCLCGRNKKRKQEDDSFLFLFFLSILENMVITLPFWSSFISILSLWHVETDFCGDIVSAPSTSFVREL